MNYIFIHYDSKEEYLHREQGPAVTWEDGRKQWYLFGEEYTEEEFEAALTMKAFW